MVILDRVIKLRHQRFNKSKDIKGKSQNIREGKKLLSQSKPEDKQVHLP